MCSQQEDLQSLPWQIFSSSTSIAPDLSMVLFSCHIIMHTPISPGKVVYKIIERYFKDISV